jgi:hypothetical protein
MTQSLIWQRVVGPMEKQETPEGLLFYNPRRGAVRVTVEAVPDAEARDAQLRQALRDIVAIHQSTLTLSGEMPPYSRHLTSADLCCAVCRTSFPCKTHRMAIGAFPDV